MNREIKELLNPVSECGEQVEWDGSGLPPVGCEIKTEKGIGIVLSVSDFDGGVVTYSYNDGCSIGCAWNNKSWVNPIETPEQKQARERDECVNQMLKDAGYVSTVEEFRSNELPPELDVVFDSIFNLYDAGYRKPELLS